MKLFYFYFATALTAMAMLTSCEPIEDWEDRHEARTLDGSWTGYIDTYYFDRWGLTGDNYRTTMYFEREDSYGGWGYEVDYDLNNRYSDYYYCEFTWSIYKGTIRISYADSWNDVFIRDYSLSDNYFEGYMDDGTSTDIVFRLRYDNGFNWGYWNTRSTTRSSADGTTVKASGKFVKRD